MSHVPIHVHSEYSALDSTSTALEIAQRCQEIGSCACGITDHGTVAGHLEFDQVMREHDLRPLLGLEAYHGIVDRPKTTDQAHLILGAKSNEGLRNLWRISSKASSNFYRVPRVNWDMLRDHSEGIFATSACIQGLVSQGIPEEDYDALNRYLEIFKDRFFIELHAYPTEWQREINKQLVQQADLRGIPMIVASDAHFARPEDYETHDAYVAMNTGDNIMVDPTERKMWHPKSLYIQSDDELRENLSYLSEQMVDEALRNSYELAISCNAELPSVEKHLPIFMPAKSPWLDVSTAPKTAAEALIDLVESGLERRYEAISEEIADRVRHEVTVILEAGLESYFLIVWDLCQFSDKEGIQRGPARGSSAGSIVAYLLGITEIDPIRYGLIFERFYNAGRTDAWPDIDIDFPQEARSKVKDYLARRWGEDRVITIGNVRRMAPRETLNRTFSACGVTFDEMMVVKKFAESVPDMDILTLDHVGWSRETDPGKTVYVMDHVGDQITRWVENQPADRQPILQRWLELVDVVCTRVSGYGVHASGIVVSDVNLDSQLPAMWSAKQELLMTQFPMGDVEKRGFPKIDILGLRNLDTLAEWERLTGDQINWNELPSHCEQGDSDFFSLMDQGQTLGIFQMEGDYARVLSRQLRPRSIEDLSLLVAMNRPGPIRAGVPEAYIARRNGVEEVTYDHPILESILGSTKGLWCFQEQVLQFFNELGYTLSESDAVRKILGKKKPTEMQKLYEGQGEWQGKGYQEIATAKLGSDIAERIWEQIEGFSSYAFNLCHSVSYATLAYGTLMAKNKPREYLIAAMKTDPERVGAYVSEARRMGITVMAPDVLKSDADVSIVDEQIYFGLTYIKGIGRPAAEMIKHLRQHWDISTPELVREALAEETALWQESPLTSRQRLSPKTRLKVNQIDRLAEVGAFGNDIPLHTKQKAEKEHLGVIISDNVDQIFMDNHELVDSCDTYATLYEDSSEKVWLPGAVSSVTPKMTRRDKKAMGVVSIEYGENEIEFAVWPGLWANYKWLFRERTPGIFCLKRNKRGSIEFVKGLELNGL